jgi:glycosyltransferase involved in cell wall biosynthesis
VNDSSIDVPNEAPATPGSPGPLPSHLLAASGPVARVVARLASRALVAGFRLSIPLARCVSRFLRRPSGAEGLRVVLTGLFLSDAWLEAHVRPLAGAARLERILIVTDRPLLELPKTAYVCPPSWLQLLTGRIPARAAWCVLTVLRTRPHAVGGFHLLLNGLVALVAARLVGARAFYFCVGGWTETWGGGARSENRLFGRQGRDDPALQRALFRLVAQFDLILTMGTRARSYLRREGALCPIEVMSGGIDAGRYAARSERTGRDLDLVFVGRLVPVKRVDVLLEAAARVARERPGLRVAIVGDGPLRGDLERQAADLGLAGNLSFLGHRDDVAKWLARARVFVLTSDSEGLALSVMEASMAGLPCVVSDVGDLADLVVDGRNGWRVPRRDPEALARRLLELLSDTERLQAFSSAALEAAQPYSLESMTRRWDQVLAAVFPVPPAGTLDP